MPIKKRNRETQPVYGAVCLDWNNERVYTSFSINPQELIDIAEGIGHGIIAIEEAHAGKPPIWERNE